MLENPTLKSSPLSKFAVLGTYYNGLDYIQIRLK